MNERLAGAIRYEAVTLLRSTMNDTSAPLKERLEAAGVLLAYTTEPPLPMVSVLARGEVEIQVG